MAIELKPHLRRALRESQLRVGAHGRFGGRHHQSVRFATIPARTRIRAVESSPARAEPPPTPGHARRRFGHREVRRRPNDYDPSRRAGSARSRLLPPSWRQRDDAQASRLMFKRHGRHNIFQPRLRPARPRDWARQRFIPKRMHERPPRRVRRHVAVHLEVFDRSRPFVARSKAESRSTEVSPAALTDQPSRARQDDHHRHERRPCIVGSRFGSSVNGRRRCSWRTALRPGPGGLTRVRETHDADAARTPAKTIAAGPRAS